jgi:flagellar basal-body rod protein FlgB
MFIEKLLNEGSTPLLEQTLRFTAARHDLIADDVVNISTPNYKQKDLDLPAFQHMLAERVEERESVGAGNVDFSDIGQEIEQPHRGMLFHDGANRSMEQLMSDQAKNALMHNMAIELLRQQFQTLELALKERVS